MESKSHIVLILCFAIAVIVLYARVLIPYDTSPLPLSEPVSPASDDIITIHYHERPPYYTTGPYGVYGL